MGLILQYHTEFYVIVSYLNTNLSKTTENLMPVCFCRKKNKFWKGEDSCN